jgi:hypothetical protein
LEIESALDVGWRRKAVMLEAETFAEGNRAPYTVLHVLLTLRICGIEIRLRILADGPNASSW